MLFLTQAPPTAPAYCPARNASRTRQTFAEEKAFMLRPRSRRDGVNSNRSVPVTEFDARRRPNAPASLPSKNASTSATAQLRP